MPASTAFDRITIEVGKMNGQPCIRGLRLTVRRVLEALSTYDSREELRADRPSVQWAFEATAPRVDSPKSSMVHCAS